MAITPLYHYQKQIKSIFRGNVYEDLPVPLIKVGVRVRVSVRIRVRLRSRLGRARRGFGIGLVQISIDSYHLGEYRGAIRSSEVYSWEYKIISKEWVT